MSQGLCVVQQSGKYLICFRFQICQLKIWGNHLKVRTSVIFLNEAKLELKNEHKEFAGHDKKAFLKFSTVSQKC